MSLREGYTTLHQFSDMGSFRLGMTTQGFHIIIQVVTNNEDDIWTVDGRTSNRGGEEGEDSQELFRFHVRIWGWYVKSKGLFHVESVLALQGTRMNGRDVFR